MPSINTKINENTPFTEIKYRYHGEPQIDLFISKIDSTDWNEIKSDNISHYTENFLSKLNEIYVACFPLTTKSYSKKRLRNPWMNSDLLNKIKTKALFFKLHKLGVVSSAEHKRFNNFVNSETRRIKRDYYIGIFHKYKNHIGKTWETLRELLNSGGSDRFVKSIIMNNIKIVDPNSISRLFNEYFLNTPILLDQEIPHTNIDPLQYVKRVDSTISLSPVGAVECNKCILNLNNTKTDLNTIPVKLLKTISNFISPIFSDIMNLSFVCGTFPECLKEAIILPIHKKGNKDDICNYRPISLLPIFSKVYEKILLSRLISFTNSHSIIAKCQFGFQKNMSTSDALVYLSQLLYDALDSKCHSIAVFIDFRKAFDTLNHRILLSKLERYGIRGIALSLIQSYLSNRRQRVKVANSISDELISNMSVPQGSNLGPFLFLLYVNDLVEVSSAFTPIMFADDTTLVFKDKDASMLESACNTELQKFQLWANANKLSVNYDKTFMMFFSNSKTISANNFSISMNGQLLDVRTEGMFLGVKIDATLSFSAHIDYICSKLSRTVGIIYRLKELVPKMVKISLYNTLFYPLLTYNILVWGSTTNNHLYPLQILQKRIVRIIDQIGFRDHTNPSFFNNKLLKLPDVHEYFVAIYMYKNLDAFNTNADFHHYNTRGREELRSDLCRLKKAQMSIKFVGPKIWNQLPASLKGATSLPTFKRYLKNYLIDKYSDASNL